MLRYKLELEKSGFEDGPRSELEITERLQSLVAIQNIWSNPRPRVIAKRRIPILTKERYGEGGHWFTFHDGGLVRQTRDDRTSCSQLEIIDLSQVAEGGPFSIHKVSLKYRCSMAIVDPQQDLLIGEEQQVRLGTNSWVFSLAEVVRGALTFFTNSLVRNRLPSQVYLLSMIDGKPHPKATRGCVSLVHPEKADYDGFIQTIHGPFLLIVFYSPSTTNFSYYEVMHWPTWKLVKVLILFCDKHGSAAHGIDLLIGTEVSMCDSVLTALRVPFGSEYIYWRRSVFVSVVTSCSRVYSSQGCCRPNKQTFIEVWAMPPTDETAACGQLTLRAKFELPKFHNGCLGSVRFNTNNETFEETLLAGKYHDFTSPHPALITLSIRDHNLVIPISTLLEPCESQINPPTIPWSQWSSSLFLCHGMPPLRAIWGYRIMFPDKIWDFSPRAVKRTQLPCRSGHDVACKDWRKVMPTTLSCRKLKRVLPCITEWDRVWIAETASGPKVSLMHMVGYLIVILTEQLIAVYALCHGR